VSKLIRMFTAATEPDMTTTLDIRTSPRVLAHRTADGIDVTLLWDPTGDRAFVVVLDSKDGVAFQVEVGNHNPMQVFHHPYAHSGIDRAA
jgi:hypothetical protein